MLESYLTASRVAILEETTKEDVFRALVDLVCRDAPELDPGEVFARVWQREESFSTRVSSRIAIPHAQMPGIDRSIAAFAKSDAGIVYDVRKEERVHLFAFILGSGGEHLAILREFADRLRDEELCDRLLAARSRRSMARLLLGPRPTRARTRAEKTARAVSRWMLRSAVRLAREVGARAILLHADALEDDDLARLRIPWQEVVVVTQGRFAHSAFSDQARAVVPIPFRGMNRHNQVELALLFLLSQGALGKDDLVVNVMGLPGSGELDSILLSDVGKEFRMYFGIPRDRGGDVDPKILARAIQLAQELAAEGREGKPVGSLLVLGDHDRVREHSQQMVMNPFHGYPEAERNLLDPSLEETLKEFSRIDGAYLVRGDGVVMSAGTYLTAPEAGRTQPGLGARHAAAAAITAATAAIAVAISESTKKVSIYVAGECVTVL